MNQKIFITVALLTFIYRPSSSLKCYECNNCNDPFNRQETLRECPLGYDNCVKSYSFDGAIPVRACSPSCVQTGYRTTVSVGGVFCCRTDGCNGASKNNLRNFVLVMVCTVYSLIMKI